MQSDPPPIRSVVCKASPVGDQVIAPRVLEISLSIESYSGPAGTEPGNDRCCGSSPARLYRRDAQLIRDALRALPMGTRDQLLIMLLEDYASILRIPGDDYLRCGDIGPLGHRCTRPVNHRHDHQALGPSGGVIGWAVREYHDEEQRLRRAMGDALDQLAENTDAAAILRRALETEAGGA